MLNIFTQRHKGNIHTRAHGTVYFCLFARVCVTLVRIGLYPICWYILSCIYLQRFLLKCYHSECVWIFVYIQTFVCTERLFKHIYRHSIGFWKRVINNDKTTSFRKLQNTLFYILFRWCSYLVSTYVRIK